MELVVESYRIARLLPKHELYALGAQIRRAAISIPANLAEGCGSIGMGDRLRFLGYARRSTCELHTLFTAAEKLDYVNAKDLELADDLLLHVGRLNSGMRRRLVRLQQRSSH